MNIFQLIFDYITVVVLKVIAKMPGSNFNLSSYLSILTDNLGYVNWFIPFNEIYGIFSTWCTSVMVVITAFVFIKLALKSRG